MAVFEGFSTNKYMHQKGYFSKFFEDQYISDSDLPNSIHNLNEIENKC